MRGRARARATIARAGAAGLFAAGLLAFAPAPLGARARAEEPAPSGAPIEFPGVRIDLERREVHLDAWFACVVPSIRLEYLLVTDRGKMHESLLVLEGAADKVHLGLILLGLEPLPEVRYQGEARALRGPRVSIEARFEAAPGKPVVKPIEALLWDLHRGRAPDPAGFAFTGSRFLEREGAPPAFAADASGNVIALYHDPDVVLDNPRLNGGDIPLLAPTFGLVELVDWLGGDDRLAPNEGTVPERGTACVLVLRPMAWAAPEPAAPTAAPTPTPTPTATATATPTATPTSTAPAPPDPRQPEGGE